MWTRDRGELVGRHRLRAGVKVGAAGAAVALASMAATALGSSAGALARPAGTAAGTMHPRAAASSSHLGRVHLVGLTSPGAASVVAPARRHAAHRLPLRVPHARSAVRNARPQLPRVRSARTGASSARLLQSFAGLDAIENEKAAGFDLEPPDEGLGASSTRVVNFVNVVGRVYHTDGEPVGDPFYLNRFFKEPDAANTSDPRIFYDAASRRWFATMVEYGVNADGTRFTESHVDLAASVSAHPRGSWRVYRIPTSHLAHAGCPCLADYPILGVSGANVYVSTSEFQADIATGPYNGAQLYAVSKRQIVAGAAAPRVASFENLSVAGSLAGHVQPANTYGPSGTEYLLSSIDPHLTSGRQLAVWAVTNERAVTTGRGRPLLSVRVVDSEGYAFPPKAQTPPGFCPGDACGSGAGAPTTGVVNTDFDEMQEVQYINGRLVGALDTGLSVAGDSADRSGVAWFVIDPRISGGTVGRDTRVVRQGYLARNGQYLLYPHIDMVRDRSMALVFGLGGPGTFLSSAYATAAPGRGFGAIRIARAGTGPDNGAGGTDENGGVTRWGDYSNGEILPGTRRVWLATQDIPNQGTGNENWGNSIFELGLP